MPGLNDISSALFCTVGGDDDMSSIFVVQFLKNRRSEVWSVCPNLFNDKTIHFLDENVCSTPNYSLLTNI